MLGVLVAVVLLAVGVMTGAVYTCVRGGVQKEIGQDGGWMLSAALDTCGKIPQD